MDTETASRQRAAKIDRSALNDYLDCGWQLIPLHRPTDESSFRGKRRKDGKRPLHDNWTTRAYDSKKVADRCAAQGRNVGVRPGASQLVIDVDPRNGGRESFERLCSDIGANPAAWPMVITGSGGWHYYLRKPEALAVVGSLRAYPGVEFKSLGSQVVSAGSIHPDTGKHYEWDPLSEPLENAPELPPGLADLIRRPEPSASCEAGQHSPDEIAAMLDKLEPTDFREHDRWLRLMMACHHGSSGEAKAEFVTWSVRDPEYTDQADEIAYRWDSLHADERSGRVTVRTLYNFLIEAGASDAIPRGPAGDDFTDDEEDDELDALPVDPELSRLNKLYAKVTSGGRVRIMCRPIANPEDPGRREWTELTQQDFALKLSHKRIERPKPGDRTKSEVVPLSKAWLEWPGHRRAAGVTFDPTRPSGAIVGQNTEDEGWLNVWTGWGVEPQRGDWSRLQEMMREVLCSGEDRLFDYLVRWLAWKVQNAGRPPEVAVAMTGPKGCGKTTLGGRVMAPIFGSHSVVPSSRTSWRASSPGTWRTRSSSSPTRRHGAGTAPPRRR